MEKETIAFIAQVLIASTIVPYVISIFRQTVKPNRVSWFIWSVVGFAFWLVTPEDADEITKTLTFFFMFNPTVVFILTLFKGENVKVDALEKFSLGIGVLSIVVWYFAQESAGVLPISIAIVADLCALLPTIRFVYSEPQNERPFAWMLYFVGFTLALFSVEHYTLVNLILPVYMIVGSFSVVYPLVSYRLRKGVAFREWII